MPDIPDATVGGSQSQKSKHRRKKNVDVPIDAASSASTDSKSSMGKTDSKVLNNGMSEKLLKQLTNVMLTSGADGLKHGDIKEKKCKDDYQFWRTQPVLDLNESVSDNCAIEPDKKPEDIRQEPYSLPAEFTWCEVSLDDEAQLEELYVLLYENYVEDDDHLFRFNYSKPFLKWALQPPGWRPDWHVGLRVVKSKKLVGFIAAIPLNLQIFDKKKNLVEINFLCVHKKLRSKRMAPVLIREITRRVHLQGLFQALYTSGAVLPRPVSVCRYWHRPLNPRKLVECGFSHLSHNMTLQRTIKLHRLPETTLVKGFRQMTRSDVPKAWALLTKNFEKYSLHPNFSKEEFAHFFIPRDDIVNSFVVENEEKHITDFCSYYVLPSSIMNHEQHSVLRAAYSFYNISTVTPYTALIQDMMIVAKQLKFDVFNALDLMEHKKFLEELKFGVGDGNLHYYLYNWRCPIIPPEQIAVVLH